MKKSSSAPNLIRLQSVKTGQPATLGLAASARRATGSSSSLTSFVQDDVSSALQPRASFGGSNRHLSRSSATTARRPSSFQLTHAAFTPAPLPQPDHQIYSALEQVAADSGKWFLEGASHGLAATDCFSLFGYPSEAPNLRDEGSPDTSKERARKTAEAACLLTPASGQERDAGSQLRSQVQRAEVITQMQTQMRFAEEIRRVAEAESLHMARHSDALKATALRAAHSSPRYRRERRKAASGGDDPFCTRPGEPARLHTVSPRTAQALSEAYGQDAALRNTRSVDDEDSVVANGGDELRAGVAGSIDLPHPHRATNIVCQVDNQSPLSQDSSLLFAGAKECDENTPVRLSPAVVSTPRSPFEAGSLSAFSTGNRSSLLPFAVTAEARRRLAPPASAAPEKGARKGDSEIMEQEDRDAASTERTSKDKPRNDDIIRKDGNDPWSIPGKHDDQGEERRSRGDHDKENGGMGNAVPFVRRSRSGIKPSNRSGVPWSLSSGRRSGRVRH